MSTPGQDTAAHVVLPADAEEYAVAVSGLGRRFGSKAVLDDVSLHVPPGQIHALLGPNGAGKTTLLRTLIGLVEPSSGTVHVHGRAVHGLAKRDQRAQLALIPSGDRTFYLRLSGLENLIFFARLQGLRYRAARSRALACLESVGLADSARLVVSAYSHGMQKRLSVARAMLIRPRVLLVDEATHDLDPEAAARVQLLVSQVAESGTAVLWATQRLDEIRGFAHRVTVLRQGQVRFSGTVAQLQSVAVTRRYVLHVATAGSMPALEAARRTLGARAAVAQAEGEDQQHLLVGLPDEAVLGDVVTALTLADVRVLACREERSELETAFLVLTRKESA